MQYNTHACLQFAGKMGKRVKILYFCFCRSETHEKRWKEWKESVSEQEQKQIKTFNSNSTQSDFISCVCILYVDPMLLLLCAFFSFHLRSSSWISWRKWNDIVSGVSKDVSRGQCALLNERCCCCMCGKTKKRNENIDETMVMIMMVMGKWWIYCWHF